MSTQGGDKLSLRPVSAGVADALVLLPLHDAQRIFIASNADSLALAREHPNMRPRAIFLGDALVGFALHAESGSAGRRGTHVLYRLMIAAPWQGQGHGRTALKLLLDEMGALGAARVALYYAPANVAARALYAAAGFVEQGLDEDGEMMAALVLA